MTVNGIARRLDVLGSLRRELVGPDTSGKPLDTTHPPLVFESRKEARGPWYDAATGEEILTVDRPTKRYGVAVLFPRQEHADPIVAAEGSGVASGKDPLADSDELEGDITSTAEQTGGGGPADDDDLDLSGANEYRPSTLAVTFHAELLDGAKLRVTARGGRYTPIAGEFAAVPRHQMDPPSPGRSPSDSQAAPDVEPASEVEGFAALDDDEEDQLPASGDENDIEVTSGGSEGHLPDTSADPPPDGSALRKRRRAQLWRRSPVLLEAEFAAEACRRTSDGMIEGSILRAEHIHAGLESLTLKAYARPWPGGTALITVSLTNNAAAPDGPVDHLCLFQCELEVAVDSPDHAPHILPYPERASGGGPTSEALPAAPYQTLDEARQEEASLELLYRSVRTFAVGHGCAAGWTPGAIGVVDRVWAECLPAVETPSTTPDITDDSNQPITVEMHVLAGLAPGKDGFEDLRRVADAYRDWIKKKETALAGLAELRGVGEAHLARCQETLARIEKGIALLQSRPDVAKAFRLANHALLRQQLRSGFPVRPTTFDRKSQRLQVEGTAQQRSWDPSSPQHDPKRGKWRAFQIAFLLATLPGVVEEAGPDRETVDLIFFPTGGGKTEAYLGLAAFTVFFRRLLDQNDAGTDVLMRYTLRLLTAQRFNRAAALICAMELLREDDESALGSTPFSIGIWVGGDVTPNSRKDALASLRKLMREAKAENPFLLLRCPWCLAQMGPVQATGKAGGKQPDVSVAGYEPGPPPSTAPAGMAGPDSDTVRFSCPDGACEFHSAAGGLPVFVVDTDVYTACPTLVIGTVDKFANLAWRPEARGLFGIGERGKRLVKPPSLIIQDELHLIAGPLGSMVGLYESVIERLCIDERGGTEIKPKIVASTATIRRYRSQIRGLYARESVALFPPPGLDARDSFFARYATVLDAEGKEVDAPGRLYVGVLGGGLGSVQTAQVRTFSALLQAPVPFTPAEQDPWWTLLAFFNSLRELGTSRSLLDSDIRNYLRVMRLRGGLDPKDVRRAYNIFELTARLRNEEVPAAIEALEVRTTDKKGAVDVCLASSMIEVGVDIVRLSLIAVIGQPKSTSQYIQVTGRVGREWRERPGLVVTILSPSKPRDRSHYEKFRSYHDRLYAQVEPTSVTPFATPVLQRALHGAALSYIRQSMPLNAPPDPPPTDLIDEATRILEDRAAAVDKEEVAALRSWIGRRRREWEQWEYEEWLYRGIEEPGLMRRPGQYVNKKDAEVTWAIPNSMRNVDAECKAVITGLYRDAAAGADDDDPPDPSAAPLLPAGEGGGD